GARVAGRRDPRVDGPRAVVPAARGARAAAGARARGGRGAGARGRGRGRRRARYGRVPHGRLNGGPGALIGPVGAAFRIESFGIALPQLVDVAGRDVVEREAEHGRERADVPEAVAELLRERVAIERGGVEEMLLDDLRHLARLAGEPERGVGELLV